MKVYVGTDYLAQEGTVQLLWFFDDLEEQIWTQAGLSLHAADVVLETDEVLSGFLSIALKAWRDLRPQETIEGIHEGLDPSTLPWPECWSGYLIA